MLLWYVRLNWRHLSCFTQIHRPLFLCSFFFSVKGVLGLHTRSTLYTPKTRSRPEPRMYEEYRTRREADVIHTGTTDFRVQTLDQVNHKLVSSVLSRLRPPLRPSPLTDWLTPPQVVPWKDSLTVPVKTGSPLKLVYTSKTLKSWGDVRTVPKQNDDEKKREKKKTLLCSNLILTLICYLFKHHAI